MNLVLEEIDLSDAAPAHHAPAAEFEVGQAVQPWHARTWWYGKITYKTRAGTYNVRVVGAREAITEVIPSCLHLVESD